jgi:hypothetical protein
MAHTFEIAPSGRSKCRGCGQTIERGAWRFGERLPNPFAEGDMTLWFHPVCAAYKRPEPVLETLEAVSEKTAEHARAGEIARHVASHRRLQRIDGIERSPSAQAKCRHCREPIERGAWRIRLVFYEDGRFSPGGFVHLQCRADYFEISDVLEHALHFSPGLTPDDTEELKRAFGS